MICESFEEGGFGRCVAAMNVLDANVNALFASSSMHQPQSANPSPLRPPTRVSPEQGRGGEDAEPGRAAWLSFLSGQTSRHKAVPCADWQSSRGVQNMECGFQASHRGRAVTLTRGRADLDGGCHQFVVGRRQNRTEISVHGSGTLTVVSVRRGTKGKTEA